MFEKVKKVWGYKDLRNKILITIGILFLIRLIAHIPVPGIDTSRLQQFFEGNKFLGMLNLFSGGTMQNFSIAMMGVSPYINASIIMQLLTMIVPKLEAMQKEGEEGRRKINQYTRYLTVPLAAIQAYGMIIVLTRGNSPVISQLDPWILIMTIVIITAGTLLMMWLGEMITEAGIGNGISLIITAGIIAGIPNATSSILAVADSTKIFMLVIILAILVAQVFAIVVVTEGQRNIPVSYARRVRGTKVFGGVDTHLPIRVNIAGVIPIIFALSIMMFPETIAQFFAQAKTAWIANSALFIQQLFANKLFYGIFYFILVVGFCFFYTTVVFKPKDVAENLQKQGGFVPGLRPGPQTADYIRFIVFRITTFGALFLGVIAVLPVIMQEVTKIQTLIISGTGVLILVSVVVETMKQLRAQIAMRSYDIY